MSPFGIMFDAICPNRVIAGLGARQDAFVLAARGQTL